jgi:type 1 glutamine amidotransferase
LGGEEKPYPAIELHETEVYLNQVFTGERTILLGVKFREEKSGKLYMQDRGGWYMKTEKGCVLYFMAGHSAKDFENPAYAQIVVNAVNYKP